MVRATLMLITLLFCGLAQAQQGTNGWDPVEQALGRAGQFSDGVYKVSFPRTDLTVRIGSTRVEAGAGLGTWMAFRREGSGYVTVGDVVVLDREIDGVISALQAGGLQVTAIHNHLAGEQPSVMYIHFFGRGELKALLPGLQKALAATATPTGPAKPQKDAISYDRAGIEKTLGEKGNARGSVLAFSFPRPHEIRMHHVVLPPAMGMATAINFQPSPRGVAATGDYVVTDDEVNPVIAALRKGGASVTAVHNHLIHDEPRMTFIHFWAEGAAEKVAQTLRSALDASRN